jgi:hypothetical protein
MGIIRDIYSGVGDAESNNIDHVSNFPTQVHLLSFIFFVVLSFLANSYFICFQMISFEVP